MIILIAESKTMSGVQEAIDDDIYRSHMPVFGNGAAEIAGFLSGLDVAEFSERVGVSTALASKALSTIYDFPNKSMGLVALRGFTGEVFKALDVASLPQMAVDKYRGKFFIVSSLYGLLRADDIIKPYRLDYTSSCAPDGSKIFSFWKKKLTDFLLSLVKEKNDREVLDLLPGDAARCFDMNELSRHVRVEKVEFKTITGRGEMKTPHSGRLKELRGLLLREIIRSGVDNLDEVRRIECDTFAPYHTEEEEGMPVFIS